MVPPGRQIQCATFDLEDKNVSRRRNLPDWMQEIAGEIRWTIWTTAELEIGVSAEQRTGKNERQFLGLRRAGKLRYWLS